MKAGVINVQKETPGKTCDWAWTRLIIKNKLTNSSPRSVSTGGLI